MPVSVFTVNKELNLPKAWFASVATRLTMAAAKELNLAIMERGLEADGGVQKVLRGYALAPNHKGDGYKCVRVAPGSSMERPKFQARQPKVDDHQPSLGNFATPSEAARAFAVFMGATVAPHPSTPPPQPPLANPAVVGAGALELAGPLEAEGRMVITYPSTPPFPPPPPTSPPSTAPNSNLLLAVNAGVGAEPPRGGGGGAAEGPETVQFWQDSVGISIATALRHSKLADEAIAARRVAEEAAREQVQQLGEAAASEKKAAAEKAAAEKAAAAAREKALSDEVRRLQEVAKNSEEAAAAERKVAIEAARDPLHVFHLRIDSVYGVWSGV